MVVTSQEEALDAFRIVVQINGFAEHSDGSPVVPETLLHLRKHPHGMYAWAPGVIQRQSLLESYLCLSYMA